MLKILWFFFRALEIKDTFSFRKNEPSVKAFARSRRNKASDQGSSPALQKHFCVADRDGTVANIAAKTEFTARLIAAAAVSEFGSPHGSSAQRTESNLVAKETRISIVLK